MFNVWASSSYDGALGRYDFRREQARVYDSMGEAGGYCSNPRYDNDISTDGEAIPFRDVGCSFLERSEVSRAGDSHLLLITATRDTFAAYHAEDPAELCDADSFTARGLGEHCPAGSNPTFSNAFGRCYCEFVESNFVAGAEHSTVSLVHAFKSRFESGVAAVTHVRVKGEETVLATFAEAEEVRLPMMKVLEWLDVDLDDTSKPGGPPRLAGVSIEASLNYYNFHQAPGFEKQFTLDAGEVVCIMELELLGVEIEKGEGVSVEGRAAEASEEGEEESAAHSRGVSYKLDEELMSYALKTPSSVGAGAYVVRHELGVRFNVVAGGVISELDYALLFETFIQAFLLLNVANLMCKFIAYECLGTKSRMFKEFGEHEVSYENEYAQFAVQSIVAAHAFERLDTDGSGTISEAELVKALRSAQGKHGRNTEEDNRALAAFIIACGDKASEEDGEEPDGEISVTEWFDMFASGPADSSAIRENIRGMGMDNIHALRRATKDSRERRRGFMTPSLRRGLAVTGAFQAAREQRYGSIPEAGQGEP